MRYARRWNGRFLREGVRVLVKELMKMETRRALGAVFMASLKTRGITLNRKVLADLAVRDLPAFGRLVQAEEPATT
jgi:ribosomal protein L20